MALPSAQLGSMPSLNVPSYVPTTVIQKEPKAWEKALLAVLANAGSNVASQGIMNVMQPDYAGQTIVTPEQKNEKPTTRLQRFFTGPTVNRATNEQRQQMLAKMAGEIGLSELNSQVGPRDVFNAREAELRSLDDNARQALANRALFVLGRSGQRTQQDISAADIASREKLAKAQEQFNTPYRAAQITKLGSDIDYQNEQIAQSRIMRAIKERMSQELDPKTGLSPRQQAVQEAAARKPEGTTPAIQAGLIGDIRSIFGDNVAGTVSSNPPKSLGALQPSITGIPISESTTNPPAEPSTLEKLRMYITGQDPTSPEGIHYAISQIRAEMPYMNDQEQLHAAKRIEKLLSILSSSPVNGQNQ